MTAAQMDYEFEVGYDRITNFDSPGYTKKEKSTFLTKAQEELVLDLLKKPDHYTEAFKKSVSKLKASSEITGASITAGSGVYASGKVVTVPTASLLVNNEAVNLKGTAQHFYPNTDFLNVRVKPVDDDYYHANIRNPFKKPTEYLVWRIDVGSSTLKQHVYIIPALCTLEKVILHYYRKPEPIIIMDSTYVVGDGSIDGKTWSSYTATELACELDPILHREIVDRAVKLAYAAIQDQAGFQISSAQEQQKEKI